MGWRRGGHLCRVADNTVWSHWQVVSRSSEVNFTKNYTLLYHYYFKWHWSIDKNSTCTVWSDCTELHSQWVTSCLIMLHCMIIATTAIKVASATKYCAISQVQPEIFSQITFLTLPATWRHFPSIIQLHQVSWMPLTHSQTFNLNCKQ